MQIIIPMSGASQRFFDQGYTIPKPFLPVGNLSIIEIIISMFPGNEDILFIINEDQFDDRNLNIVERLTLLKPNCEIAVIPKHKKGPGWAIWQARKFINYDSPVIVNYCDFGWDWDYTKFKNLICDKTIDGVVATYTGFHPHMLSNTEYAYVNKKYNKVIDIQEKNSFTKNPMAEEASSGTYAFKSGKILLEALQIQIENNDSLNGEFYISLTYRNMIKRKMKIHTFLIDKFCQWGTPSDYEEFERHRIFFSILNSKSKPQVIVQQIGLLAGGLGRRFAEVGYNTPKASLPINGSLITIESIKGFGDKIPSRSILALKSLLKDENLVDLLKKMKFVLEILDSPSEGQASSARILLEKMGNESAVIATCDSILFPEATDLTSFSGNTIGVWTVLPNSFHKANSMQFGWVRLDGNNQILEVTVKKTPTDFINWRVITGNFFFANAYNSAQLIREFEMNDQNRINGEFYLDSILAYALDNGWNVISLNSLSFESLGTPSEYETYRYWEDFFNSHKEYL